MNNNLKMFLMLILGMILSYSTVAIADTYINSNEVYYDNTSSGGTYTNVKESIDELYNLASHNGSTFGDAIASDILSGKTALSGGEEITGSMVNNGGVTKSLGMGETYTYPANNIGETIDLGTTNIYRYVNAANVYEKGKADGASAGKSYYYSGSASGIGNNTERTILTVPASGRIIIGLTLNCSYSGGFVSINFRIDNTYLLRNVDPEGNTSTLYSYVYDGTVTEGQKIYLRVQNESNQGTWSYNMRVAIIPSDSTKI